MTHQPKRISMMALCIILVALFSGSLTILGALARHHVDHENTSNIMQHKHNQKTYQVS